MKMLAIASLFGVAAAFAMPASAAMSTANCIALWNKADTNNDGTVSGSEAGPYMVSMTDAKMRPMDANMISDAEFMKACRSGAFNNREAPTIGPA